MVLNQSNRIFMDMRVMVTHPEWADVEPTEENMIPLLATMPPTPMEPAPYTSVDVGTVMPRAQGWIMGGEIHPGDVVNVSWSAPTRWLQRMHYFNAEAVAKDDVDEYPLRPDVQKDFQGH